MITCKENKIVQVYKITAIGENISVDVHTCKDFRVSPVPLKHMQVHYSKILPGDFDLLSSKKLPSRIQNVIKDNNYILC